MTFANVDPKMLAALLFFAGVLWAMGPAASLTGLATGYDESAAMVVAPADEGRLLDDAAGQQTAASRFFTEAMRIDVAVAQSADGADDHIGEERG